jgi:hypothetical protein
MGYRRKFSLIEMEPCEKRYTVIKNSHGYKKNKDKLITQNDSFGKNWEQKILKNFCEFCKKL